MWAVNLQANASAGGALSLDGVAASSATGGLLLAGGFAGQLVLGGHTLVAAGGTDAFAAELDPGDGWARAAGFRVMLTTLNPELFLAWSGAFTVHHVMLPGGLRAVCCV